MKTIVQLVPRNQFTLMQEQAKAELEKIQAAKDKKEQKEQEKVEKAKAKEEKKREREEKNSKRQPRQRKQRKLLESRRRPQVLRKVTERFLKIWRRSPLPHPRHQRELLPLLQPLARRIW